MMKKTFILMAALAIVSGAASCKKQKTMQAADGQQTGEITLCTQIDELETKSTAVAGSESTVNTVEYYIFHEDGNLDTYVSTNTISGVKAKVTFGKKHVYAVVNGNDPSSPKPACENDMANFQTALLARENGLAAFVMVGSRTDCDIQEAKPTEPFNVQVHRLLSRIRISKITNSLDAGLGELKIKDIYITNVQNSVKYFSSAAPTTFAHKLGANLTNFGWLRDTYADKVLATGEAITDTHIFYCYPNTATEDCKSTDDPEKLPFTRIVIVAEINGEEYFYPISVNAYIPGSSKAMKSNTSYNFSNINIKHVGTKNVEEDVKLSDMEFTVNIQPWKSEEIPGINI